MGRQYPFTIENGLGEALTFLRIVRGPDGDRVEAEGRAQPGAGPPMHVHKLQEETMQVVSGKLGYQVLGEEPTFAGPGGKRTPEHLRRAYLTTRYRSE